MATVLNEEIADNNDGNFDLIAFIEYSGSLDLKKGYVEAYGYEPLPPNTIRSMKIEVRGCKRKVKNTSGEKRAQKVFAGSPQSAPKTQLACRMWWQYLL